MPAHTTAAQQDTTTLEVRRIIKAPRERVFQAWTTPADVKRWSAPGPIEVVLSEIDLRVGGRYKLNMREPDGTPHDAYGEYREVDPPRRVVYTWNWVQEPDVRNTIVTVEFNDLGERGTEVVLRHEGLTPKQAASHTGGWTSILEKMEAALQQ
jgi:glutathione S-transferase